MGSPNVGTAAPWCSVTDIPARYATFVESAAPGEIGWACQMASDILWARTGRQWGGQVANLTLRPLARRVNDGSPRPIYGVSGTGSLFGYFGGIANAPWIAAWGYATCVSDVHRGGGCRMVPELTLGVYPLDSITQVKVDGIVYPGPNGTGACTYRIDDYRYLVRTDGSLWPGCQDVTLDDTQPNTWSVTFTAGTAPPTGGQKSAGHLAGEILAAWSNSGTSQLPPRAKQAVRAGLTVAFVDPEEILKGGLTGIPAVDLWITSVNPKGLQRRATISSVDRPRSVRRINT